MDQVREERAEAVKIRDKQLVEAVAGYPALHVRAQFHDAMVRFRPRDSDPIRFQAYLHSTG